MQPEIKELKGFKSYHYEIIDSTNYQARKLIEQHVRTPFLVSAEEQTNGKGRNGRQWVSESGSLYLSIVLEPRKNIKPEIYSYVAALAVSDFLNRNNLNNYIKWPNDILVNDKKISGILLELYKGKVIIGIGVNVIGFPEYTENIEATSLFDNGIEINSEDVKTDIVKIFKNIESLTVEDILSRIESKLNKEKEYELRNGIVGKINSISTEGNLMLQDSKGDIHEINYGEILEL